MVRRVTFFLMVCLLTVGSMPRVGQAAESKQKISSPKTPLDPVEGEYIVKFRPGVTTQESMALAFNSDGKVIRKLLNPRTWLFKFDSEESAEAVVRRIKEGRNIEYVEPNGYLHTFYTPNDPLYLARRQWNFGQLNVSRAWNYSRGRGAVVAVIDTGVAQKLSDFSGTRFTRGYDFVNRDRYAYDDHGHGSHVAGTIAQSTNNGRGVAGIAYRAKIMPVKVLDSGGFGTFSDVADGIRWAANHGAHIINLSLGSSTHSQAMKEAVDYARYRKDVVVVAAAGNGGTERLAYPAAYNSVLAISATDYNRNLAWYSSWGSGLALTAPGGDTTVDHNGDGRPDGILQQTTYGGLGYRYFQGTSMAAPHVSAVAALIRGQKKRGARYIINTLKYSARDVGPPGYDPKYGWGMVSAYGAVRYQPMVAPRLTNPTGLTRVRAGSRMTVTWNRKGKKGLRYQLAYSPNAHASGIKNTDFENGAIDNSYRHYGNTNWAASRVTAADGAFSARSGASGDSQESELSLSTKMTRAGVLSFSYRVSSEAGYDFLKFYIDNHLKLQLSGDVDWTDRSFSIPAGPHRLRWVYSKDQSMSDGLDAAFVDNIKVTNVSTSQWKNIGGLTSKGANSKIWTVPNQPGSDYRLRIRAFNGVKYGVWINSRGRIIVE